MKQSLSKEQVGVKENIVPFSLLVVINLFVGSMVGLERTILPIIGEKYFGIASASAALSFIISFGFSKAIVNFFAGNVADRIGRKQVLLLGWGIGLFVPLLVIFAQFWWVIVFANILLGINQGLTWSMTVNMKIDLAKTTQRGLAVGALFTGWHSCRHSECNLGNCFSRKLTSYSRNRNSSSNG